MVFELFVICSFNYFVYASGLSFMHRFGGVNKAPSLYISSIMSCQLFLLLLTFRYSLFYFFGVDMFCMLPEIVFQYLCFSSLLQPLWVYIKFKIMVYNGLIFLLFVAHRASIPPTKDCVMVPRLRLSYRAIDNEIHL